MPFVSENIKGAHVDTFWRKLTDEDHMVALADGIHEAGHVLASREFGFPVEWVSLDPEFLQKNSRAIENGCARGDPVTMTIASHLLQPIANRGCAVSRDEWETIRRYFVECHVGPMAEMEFNPHFDMAVAERDFAQANGLLWHLMKPNKIRFNQRRKQFLHDAGRFVEQYREVIFYLGVEIHNRRTLLKDEIDIAIADAKGRAFATKEAA